VNHADAENTEAKQKEVKKHKKSFTQRCSDAKKSEKEMIFNL